MQSSEKCPYKLSIQFQAWPPPPEEYDPYPDDEAEHLEKIAKRVNNKVTGEQLNVRVLFYPCEEAGVVEFLRGPIITDAKSKSKNGPKSMTDK